MVIANEPRETLSNTGHACSCLAISLVQVAAGCEWSASLQAPTQTDEHGESAWTSLSPSTGESVLLSLSNCSRRFTSPSVERRKESPFLSLFFILTCPFDRAPTFTHLVILRSSLLPS